MAKTPPKRRKQQTRETNWLVIGGLIAVGVLAFGALLFLALRPSEAEAVPTLAEYCAENSNRCASTGSESSPVTLVEVSDFGCPHCETFHVQTAQPLKEQFVDTGDVRWVALPYALSTATLPAAASAMCANEEGKYFEYTNALFAITPTEARISPEGYQQAARAVNLDMDQFTSCLESGRYISIINNNREAARNVSVTGTPTFFVNDEQLTGAQPLSVFAQVIAEKLGNQ